MHPRLAGARAPLENTHMAEIRVEPRRRTAAWVWLLVALLIVAGVAYYVFYYNKP